MRELAPLCIVSYLNEILWCGERSTVRLVQQNKNTDIDPST